MNIQYSYNIIDYDGSQLTSHWIFKNFGILGDAAAAFCGRCDVKTDKMVDLVDVRDNKPIFSESMLHVLIELFESDLTQTILLQRLLVSLAQQEIHFRAADKKAKIVRGGNDLFDDGAKLSVSIATASPVSTLIHFGINISSKGTPIKTKGLEDYQIEPKAFGQALLESFKDEFLTVRLARSKVRPVS